MSIILLLICIYTSNRLIHDLLSFDEVRYMKQRENPPLMKQMEWFWNDSPNVVWVAVDPKDVKGYSKKPINKSIEEK